MNILYSLSVIWTWTLLCCLELYYAYWCQQTRVHPVEFAAISSNRFFTHVHYICAHALEKLKLHTLSKRRYQPGALLKLTLVLNCTLLFWKMLVFLFLLGITDLFLYSVSALDVNIVTLLDAFQQLMLFASTPAYLENYLFLLIKFYSGNIFLLKY
jgi:hypothetical protein